MRRFHFEPSHTLAQQPNYPISTYINFIGLEEKCDLSEEGDSQDRRAEFAGVCNWKFCLLLDQSFYSRMLV